MNLIDSTIKFGEDILSLTDAFNIMMVSRSCKNMADTYLDKYDIFRIYKVEHNDDDEYEDDYLETKKQYVINKLNNKRIKRLHIDGNFNIDDTLMEFAFKCSNIKTLCITYIYIHLYDLICLSFIN